MIENLTGVKTITSSKSNTKASGLLKSHYSPKATILIDCLAESGDGFIAMDDIPTPKGAIRLASPKTIEQYALNLYIALRSADHKGLSRVSVIQPEGVGLATAIRDRLKKAAVR
jgi:L-threonylcarbamoyladenylate synthase